MISKVPRAIRDRILPRPDHGDAFGALSAALTGFSVLELAGTGVGDRYLAFLARVFPDVLPDLLAAWSEVERKPPGEIDAALRARILDDAKLGPFARQILELWYTATWTPMPAAWNSAYGDHHDGFDAELTAAAYPEGLMWRAGVGTHPTAARPGGFGTWAFRPREG